MRSLEVIVLHVLVYGAAEMPLTNQNHPIKTFRLDRKHKPLA